MSYQSTKLIELGSCAFRQWSADPKYATSDLVRPTNRCYKLHGYQLKALFTFGCSSLDERNWAVDFGSLKPLKELLQQQFDHTTTIDKNDPCLEIFQHLHNLGACDLRIMDGVGIEKTAEFCFKAAQTFLKDLYGDRCWVDRVEVFEHEANSAIYSELIPISYSYSTSNTSNTVAAPAPVVQVQPENNTSVFEELNSEPMHISLNDLLPPLTIHPIETPPVQSAEKPKYGPVPNGVTTNGYSGLFDNISWGNSR